VKFFLAPKNIILYIIFFSGMPNITVKKKLFLREIDEENYSDEDVELLCFNFGIEVDEITSDRKEAEKERGFSEELYKFSDEVTYKIAVPANRNDLLCLEGLARALRVFLNKESPPIYTEIKTETPVQCLVRNSVLSVRPIIVCAILRNLSFTEETLKSFMNLQDKLHQNIGRERTLVSIGTHDFDKIQPPFVYEARPPSAISFVALEQHKSMSPGELFSLYRVGGSKAKKYLHIIEDMACYPLLLDSEGVVLSLPPIINGEHSRVSTETRNVFIECTATDYVRACVVLDTIICMFSQYSQPRFTYESVEVLYPDGARQIYTMSCREETIAVDYINQHIGVTLSASVR
jgi:phenylalanyl-tRNA synthetase beta chain